jgi:hypothetical protein
MEAMHFFETSVFTRTARLRTPEDGIPEHYIFFQ